jgi:signal transduction histidine kinase
MRRGWPNWFSQGLVTWLMVAVSLSLSVLVWFSYRAVEDLRRSQELLADRRARETVDLLVTALARDMRGVQELVLASGWEAETLEPPFEARDVVADAFARYPYPESFFAWRGESSDSSVVFFDRSDRRPEWTPADGRQNRFPVTIRHEPAVSRAILERVRVDVRQARRFSTFEIGLGGSQYQVIARLFYRDPFREEIDRVVGFTVNLAWVREHYFPAMAKQVALIGRGGALAIVDDRGLPVAGTVAPVFSGPIVRRWFPVLFFDPLLVDVDSPSAVSRRSWAVEVDTGGDADLAAAARGARRTLSMAAVAVAALALGLALTARAARASARLAELRSDFVSTVTHELKTPIATIRAVGDTLVRGRISEPQAMREYAQLVVQEAKRLTRLVENLLAYARVTDVTEVYAFGPLAPKDLVDEVVKGYGAQLTEAAFELEIDVPADLPSIRGDRTALRLALDNLVDNAIRYSGTGRWLGVRAHARAGGIVRLEVSDHGTGIAPEDLALVTRRFFRGRRQRASGSGLGLAIVKRIVVDHGGTLGISSVPGQGTSVRLDLPVLEANGEEASANRRG